MIQVISSDFKLFDLKYSISGFASNKDIVEYSANRETYAKKNRGVAFAKAVREMDEYISDPIVCVN